MKRLLISLFFGLLLPCLAQSAPNRPIFVTNYVYLSVTNYVYGAVTNYVNHTNVVQITNTVNNYAYTTTTNYINATNYIVPAPGIWFTNLNVWGSLEVWGTNNPGLIQTFSGTNVTGHLP